MSLEQNELRDDEAHSQIIVLKQRIQVLQNCLSTLAKYRQPGVATNKTKFIDPKWIHGVVDIPVSLHRQRITDKLAIVFDPITLSFASLNRDVLWETDYTEIHLPIFSFPFDTITIHANIDSDTKDKNRSEKGKGKTPARSMGRQYVARSRGERKARETGGSFEHIVTFPLVALGGTILLQRILWRIKKLYVLTAKPSVYLSQGGSHQDQSQVGKEEPKNRGPTEDQHTKEGELYRAICNNDITTVKELLQNKLDINEVSGPIGTTLQAAAYHGNEEIVRLLLNEPMVKADGGPNIERAIQFAAVRGNAGVVKQLLDDGAKPNIVNDFGQTLLWLATAKGHFNVMEILLENDADPNIGDENRRTPIWWAAGQGSEDGVRLLLHWKAKPDPKDVKGETPLHWAVRNGHENVVELLTEKAKEIELLTEKKKKTRKPTTSRRQVQQSSSPQGRAE
ncbi:hypothetical protein H2204_006954 [Knufia peltigerae]|uniref:Uncharacterized protein n=1 Tax=Knufia peltigerae TaxID=1002370 RepID=A0AA38Y2R3_9EURO|nr:hypothetical protein H2204_006954 [Knufia peltigerae]